MVSLPDRYWATHNCQVADVLGEWQRARMGQIKYRQVNGANGVRQWSRLGETTAPIAMFNRPTSDRQTTHNRCGRVDCCGKFEILN